jgi:hypothetical protein
MFNPKRAMLGIALMMGMLVAMPVNAQSVKKEVHGNTTTTVSTTYTAKLKNVGQPQLVTNKRTVLYPLVNGDVNRGNYIVVPKNTVLTVKSKLLSHQGDVVTLPHSQQSFGLISPQKSTYSTKGLKNSPQVIKKLRAASKKWSKGLSNADIAAIRYYTDKGYGKINTALRDSESKPSKKVTTSIQRINTSIDQFKLTKPLTIYRGTSLVGVKKSLANQSLRVGRAYQDPAYSSCTLSQMIALGFSKQHVMLKINVPAGNYGAYIDPISTNVGEKEYLLKSGTKLIVTKIQKGDSTTRTVTNVKQKGKQAKQQVVNTKIHYTLVTLNLKK